MVGIFWVVDGKLILDASPLSEAELYGDCLGHRTSHHRHWAKPQRRGVLKPELEYDDFPRGRVTYNAKKHEFYLLLDKCIRRDKSKVADIMNSMHLPPGTVVDVDLHYRCPKCLRGRHSIDDCL